MHNGGYTKPISIAAVILAVALTTTLLTSIQRIAAFLMPVEDIAGQRKAAAPMATSGNNVYVTWWERNQTMNEPVMRISNDNGKTFGEIIMLSSK